MIISKHIHSCLLIKEKEKVALIDPGIYSIKGNGLTANELEGLDFLLITHEHSDHLHVPFIQKLLIKFPNIQIISNHSVKKILAVDNIKTFTNGNEFIEIENAPHEHIFGAPPYENTLFNIFSNLTHPGDNIHFDKSLKVLALPVQAPWGSLTQAVEQAIKIKPEYIIPIHDWHWNEEARTTLYARLKNYFEQNNIKFMGLQTREKLEV